MGTTAADEHTLLRHSVGATPIARDVVVVRGPDAVSFLQGQLSQDVASLAVGGSGWSFLLQPGGKVVAWLRASRTAEDTVVLDVDAGWASAVVERLKRFKLRVELDLEPVEWQAIALRGPLWAEVDLSRAGAAVVAPAVWPGAHGADLLGPHLALPTGVAEVSAEAFEALRIEAGVPAMGSELDSGTIPAEAGVVERSASFTKGCYVGQELVARVDSRGNNTPRKLRGVVFDRAATPEVGADLLDGDTVRGHLTSVALSSSVGTPVALAYVARSVEAPATLVARWPDGEASAQVLSLPLVG